MIRDIITGYSSRTIATVQGPDQNPNRGPVEGLVVPVESVVVLSLSGRGCLDEYPLDIDITTRKQAEEALNERLRFEKLLSDLSSRFVKINGLLASKSILGGLAKGRKVKEIRESYQLREPSVCNVRVKSANKANINLFADSIFVLTKSANTI